MAAVCVTCGRGFSPDDPDVIRCRWCTRRIAAGYLHREPAIYRPAPADKPKKSHHSKAEQERRAARKRERENYRPPCGTTAGYNAHRNRGEQACADCLRAERERCRERGPYGSKSGPCSQCGKAMWIGKSSRRDANVCHECRRKEPGKHKYTPRKQAQPELIVAVCAYRECTREFALSPKSRTRFRAGKPVYCSPSCAARTANRTRYPNGRQPKRSGKAAARRRRMLVAATWDGVTDEQILERDQWKCWICQQGIDKTLKWPDPQSASIDHLIPLSRGGDDTAGNKHSAHLGCNMSRQTGRTGEQFPPGFSPVPLTSAQIEARRRDLLCRVCGEIKARGQCALHSPVWYATCLICGAVSVARTKAKASRRTCGSSACSHGARYARHDERINKRPAHERGIRAQAMHETGMNWDEIATELGYSAGNYAAAAAARALGTRSTRKHGEYKRVPRTRTQAITEPIQDAPLPIPDPPFWWTTVRPLTKHQRRAS